MKDSMSIIETVTWVSSKSLSSRRCGSTFPELGSIDVTYGALLFKDIKKYDLSHVVFERRYARMMSLEFRSVRQVGETMRSMASTVNVRKFRSVPASILFD